MKMTLSIIKADVGSIGGHVTPGRKLIDAVTSHIDAGMDGLLTDYFISAAGDDIAILMAHRHEVGDPDVHRLAWDAFKAGTEVAKEQGL